MSDGILITDETPLEVGDIIEIHFGIIGGPDWVWMRAVQMVAIESRLQATHPEWEWLAYWFEEDEVVIRFRIGESPDPQIQEAGVTAAIIAIAVVGVSIFAWLSKRESYKIESLPGRAVSRIGIGAMGIAILIIAVIWFMSK